MIVNPDTTDELNLDLEHLMYMVRIAARLANAVQDEPDDGGYDGELINQTMFAVEQVEKLITAFDQKFGAAFSQLPQKSAA